MCVLRTSLSQLNQHIRHQTITQSEAGSVNTAFHSLFEFVTHSALHMQSQQQAYTR